MIALASGPIAVWVEDDGNICTERSITQSEFEQIQKALKIADPWPSIKSGGLTRA